MSVADISAHKPRLCYGHLRAAEIDYHIHLFIRTDKEIKEAESSGAYEALAKRTEGPEIGFQDSQFASILTMSRHSRCL
ncbi:MAG: hypothetical protein AAF950_14875 [Pseudomonadota bacterium]